MPYESSLFRPLIRYSVHMPVHPSVRHNNIVAFKSLRYQTMIPTLIRPGNKFFLKCYQDMLLVFLSLTYASRSADF